MLVQFDVEVFDRGPTLLLADGRSVDQLAGTDQLAIDEHCVIRREQQVAVRHGLGERAAPDADRRHRLRVWMRGQVDPSLADPLHRLRDQFPARQREDDVALHQAFDRSFAGRGQDACASRVANHAAEEEFGATADAQRVDEPCPTAARDRGQVQGGAVRQMEDTTRAAAGIGGVRDRDAAIQKVDEVCRNSLAGADVETGNILAGGRRAVEFKLARAAEEVEVARGGGIGPGRKLQDRPRDVVNFIGKAAAGNRPAHGQEAARCFDDVACAKLRKSSSDRTEAKQCAGRCAVAKPNALVVGQRAARHLDFAARHNVSACARERYYTRSTNFQSLVRAGDIRQRRDSGGVIEFQVGGPVCIDRRDEPAAERTGQIERAARSLDGIAGIACQNSQPRYRNRSGRPCC